MKIKKFLHKLKIKIQRKNALNMTFEEIKDEGWLIK